MLSIFLKEVQERFPDYTVSPLGTTKHTNVVRLSKDGYPALVAKTIWHDAEDPEGNMGIKAQDKAYKTEVKILKLLPTWWGVHLVKNFKTTLNRVIVTNEVQNVPWKSYKKGKSDVEVAKLLYKQIQWLHSHKIAHNDLELKNILLTSEGKPIIIDFEKSSLLATKETLENDYRVLLSNMKETSSTKAIGTFLERLSKGVKVSQTRRKN